MLYFIQDRDSQFFLFKKPQEKVGDKTYEV